MKELSAQSDAVVVATVKSRIERPVDVKFDLQVVRSLKGGLSPGAIVNVIWDGQFQWSGGVRVRESTPDTRVVEQEYTGVWFLKHTDRGWKCLKARGGLPNFLTLFYFAAVPPPSSELIKIANDRTVAEVVAAIEARAFGALENPDSLTLGEALVGSTASSGHAIYWHVLRSNARGVDKTVAMAGLVGSGEPEALKVLSDDPSLKTFPDNTWMIIDAARDQLRTPEPIVLERLVRIARSERTVANLRAAAVWALKSIHTRETVPFLAGLLEDPNPEFKVQGAMGLAAFANGCPMQTPENVLSMEYLQFKLPSPYRNQDTMAHFIMQHGEPGGEDRAAVFWRQWWTDHQQDFQDVTTR